MNPSPPINPDPHDSWTFPVKRTQRNLLMILSTAAVIWILLQQLHGRVALWTLGSIVLLSLVLLVWGRDFLLGRYHSGRRQWREAVASYGRFEKRLMRNRWSQLLAPIYLGIYSFDGVAIARNNIAQALMNLDELDEAGRWLYSALQRDPLYATPYINLGIIAAMRKDGAKAQRELQRAVDLGYSPTGAQRVLRAVLAGRSRSGKPGKRGGESS